MVESWQDRPEEAHIQQWLSEKPVRLIGVVGAGGYGKSSLVAHLYEKAEGFQGKFWANFQNPTSFSTFGLWLFRKILGDKKYKNTSFLYQKLTDDKLATELVNQLTKARYLLVMDNLETLERDYWQPYLHFLQKWLMAGGGGSILITSRTEQELQPAIRCRWLRLLGLSIETGISLLQSLGIRGTEEYLSQFVGIAEGHPLLLTLAAGWIKQLETDRNQIEIHTLNKNDLTLFDEIVGPHRDRPEVSVGKVFEESFRCLAKPMQTLLMNLSVYRRPFSTKMAKIISSGNLGEKILQREFVRRSLLLGQKIDGKWLFKFQPLIQRYAQFLLKQEGNFSKAHKQVITYFENEIRKKTNLKEVEEALELIEIIYHYCETEQYEQAADFLNSLFRFLNIRGYYKLLRDYYEMVIPKLLLNPPENKSKIAVSLCNQGFVYQELADYPQALDSLQKGLEICRQNNERFGEASALDRISTVYTFQGKSEQAIACSQKAIEIVRYLGEKHSESVYIGNLALAYDHAKNFQKAIEAYHQGIEVLRQFGDKENEATYLKNLGNVYYRQNNHSAAITLYEQSLEIAREIGFRNGEANALCDIGIIYFKQKKFSKAIKYLEPALVIYQETGNRYNEIVCSKKLEAAKMIHNFPSLDSIKNWQLANQMLNKLGVPMDKWNPITEKISQLLTKFLEWTPIKRVLNKEE